MKKLSIAAVLLVAVTASSASDEEKIRARLSGYQEVPAVSTAAAGRFVAEVARDEKSFDYEMSYSGLQGQVRQAHIHFGQKSVNGSIVIWLCGTTANPGPAGTQTCPQSGTVRGTITSANVIAAGTAAQLILAGEFAEVLAAMRAGVAYANVHTDISPGGEIRGQLRGRGMKKEHERDGGDNDDEHKH